MKRYINSESSVFDNFKISRIYIVDNAATATFDNLYIVATRTEDEFYMQYDEDELLSLNPNEIKQIEEVELIHTIHDLYLEGKFGDKQPLTGKQLKKLSDWYGFGNPKDIYPDIPAILRSIKSSVSTTLPYERTSPDEQWKNYAQSKGIDLNMDDYLMFIKSLTADQFKREIRSKNLKHLGNRLLEFELDGTYTIHNGTKLSNIRIYIKLEKEIQNGHIVLISFHDPITEK